MKHEAVEGMKPSDFLGADTSKPAVRQVYGISGSGKTCWMRELVMRAEDSPAFTPKFRIAIFDIKHDGYSDLAPPVSDFPSFTKSLANSRITVIHPDLETAQELLDDVIAELFSMSDADPEFGATLILEESSTYIRSTVNGVPPSLKRFATQGRSKRLTLILLNQRALNSKWTDTQTASLTVFRLPQPDNDLLKKRWAICPEELDGRLKERKFSFAHYDLESLDLQFYAPITLTPPRESS